MLIKFIFITTILILFVSTTFAQSNYLTQTSLPLKFNTGNPAPYGMPSTVIKIQGKEIPVLFDTGAKKSELTLSLNAIKDLHVQFTGKEICFHAMDGKYCQKEFIIPEVQIGSFIERNVKGTLLTKLWGGNDKSFIETEASRNGVLGFGLISKYNVLLDYPQSKVILVTPKNKPVDYFVGNWVSVPFQKHLLTQIKLNNELLTISWDTGAIPSVIKKSVIARFKSSPCPGNAPYSQKNYSCIQTSTFKTQTNDNLPNTWFKIIEMPQAAPFDALIGSNFYSENLVYFDFDNHRIYIKPEKYQSNTKEVFNYQ